jgi:hypothetical protein
MMRNRVRLFCGAAVVLLASGSSLAETIVFFDDFESGSMSKWTTTGTNPLTISTTQNVAPAGGQFSAYVNVSTDRMHRNLIGDNGGVELSAPLFFTSWIYDPGSGAPATRVFNEIRGYSDGSGFPNGGTTPSGALAGLLAIGKYNTVTMPGEVYNSSKYQARVAFGTNAGWFNLNGPDSPDRSAGWHEFRIEVMSNGTDVEFYVDGVLSRTISGVVNVTYDSLILGPGLGSTVGDSWIDGIQVSVPEPGSLVLLAACAAMGAAIVLPRRRARRLTAPVQD